jgi:syntaxin-binding protein 1
MLLFEKFKLAQIASIEQDLATGETAEGGAIKRVEMEMIPLLDDPNVR